MQPRDLPDDEMLQSRLPFLMHRVVARTNAAALPYFRSSGVNISEARTLIALVEMGPLCIGDLVNATCIGFSTMSHLLNRLEGDGLIRRAQMPSDNRSTRIRLTRRGRHVAEKCRTASLWHEEVLSRGLSRYDIARLKRTLVRLFDNACTGFRPDGS